MEIKIKETDGLNDFADVFYVRVQVFMKEQGFSTEQDETDKIAHHFCGYVDGIPMASARCFIENGIFTIGRIAVLKQYRKQGYASAMMHAVEAYGRKNGYYHFELGAQCQAQGFYETLGYHQFGDLYQDEHCLHAHMHKDATVVEVCCGSIEDALIAQKCGADRIELNYGLELGGLTPGAGMLKKVKESVDLPVCCMVRPRGFGFCYTEKEFEAMLLDAKELLDKGADGIVFGFLHEDGTINKEWTKKMVKVIGDKEKVFHKAFDSCPDYDEAIQTLIDCGITRILTGGGNDINQGIPTLAYLNQNYGKKIQILPGGGVNEENIQKIIKETGCHQIHMTAKHYLLDSSIHDDHAKYMATSEERLKKMKKLTEC